MNIKRNIIFALERRKKDGVLITENVSIRMRVIYNSKPLRLRLDTELMLQSGIVIFSR